MMTHLGATISFALLAAIAAALVSQPVPAYAQALDSSEVGKRKDPEKSSHDILKTLAKEVIKKPLKLNPLTSKILDTAIDTVYDTAKRKYYDPRHVKDVLIKYRDANFAIQNKAFAKRDAIEKQLQEIDAQLARAPGERDPVDVLLRQRKGLLAEQEAMDDVIDIVNKRVDTSLEIQRKFDAVGDVPTGLDQLLNELNADIGEGGGVHDDDGTESAELNCAELEAEERRIETQLKNEVVGRSDMAALARIQAAAAVLQELRVKKKNCRDDAGKQAFDKPPSPPGSAAGDRPAGAACVTGQDCADHICAAGVCMKEGAGGRILGE